MQDMSETEKAMWRAADRAVFHTDDPDLIRSKLQASYQAWNQERSTLGGYLRSARRDRDLTTTKCASVTGVPQSVWQAWEANVVTPSISELEQVAASLEFGSRKLKALFELRAQSVRHSLQDLSRFQPELLAARGAAVVESNLEWDELNSEVKARLTAWSQGQGLEFPRDLMEFLATLTDDEARQQWVDDVLAYD